MLHGHQAYSRPAARAQPAATEAVVPLSFEGTPKQIRIAYGKRFAEAAGHNVRILLGRSFRHETRHSRWVRSEGKLVETHWPWYVEKMHGVAEAINGKYEDVLLLTEHWLREHGVHEFRSPTTVPRHDNLLRFIASANGKYTAEEVKALVARRDDADPASIHNSGSIYLTYACP